MTQQNDELKNPSEPAPRNLMREHNPETWDPEPFDYDSRPTVNTWDPVAGEGVDVPGHRYDRDPDMDEEHARRLALRGEFNELDEGQPLPLLESDMRADPVEGTQGSYSVVVRLGEPCEECETAEYGVESRHTLAGVGSLNCLLCGHQISLW